jgi:hypothetical protein
MTVKGRKLGGRKGALHTPQSKGAYEALTPKGSTKEGMPRSPADTPPSPPRSSSSSVDLDAMHPPEEAPPPVPPPMSAKKHARKIIEDDDEEDEYTKKKTKQLEDIDEEEEYDEPAPPSPPPARVKAKKAAVKDREEEEEYDEPAPPSPPPSAKGKAKKAKVREEEDEEEDAPSPPRSALKASKSDLPKSPPKSAVKAKKTSVSSVKKADKNDDVEEEPTPSKPVKAYARKTPLSSAKIKVASKTTEDGTATKMTVKPKLLSKVHAYVDTTGADQDDDTSYSISSKLAELGAKVADKWTKSVTHLIWKGKFRSF